MIKKLLRGIVINTAVLVIIALRVPYGGLHITPLGRDSTPLLLGMGAIFWIVYHIATPLLKFLATPINRITLGLAGVLLNLIALYAFAYIVNAVGFGVTVTLGGIEQTFILSIIIAILTLILKKILS